MKVVFLDVDGVLNYAGTEARAPSSVIGIAEPCVKRLRKIIDITGAKIVLTSTWRNEWSHDEELCSPDGIYLTKKLKRHGMHILDKVTGNIEDRGASINAWLQKNDHVTNWVVLDDDVFHDYQSYNIMPHLILTSFADGGLQDEHVQLTIDKLM